ncbi:zinc finger protein 25-like isoform X1 [Topomyia yanbarensis]|uniref:zinc finger protein 25-like isoform X1 n=1 Tax=Topomyia yanbarensis TaxID=2498891 RepID=UPI00273CD248|nr:zinc finger protein 25-like isoform X1 [Topomyia yanbarensis]
MLICRICMHNTSSGEQVVPIFSKIGNEFVASLIIECAGVEIVEDDGLPAQICLTCLADLKQSNTFVRTVRFSDQKLRKSLKCSAGNRITNDESANHNSMDDDDLSWQMIQIHLTEVKEEEVDGDKLKDEATSQEVACGSDHDSISWNESREYKSDGEREHLMKIVEKFPSTISRKLTRSKQKQRAIGECQPTESDSDQDPPKRKVRKKCTKKRMNHVDIDDSDDENFSEAKLLSLYQTVPVEGTAHVCCACLKLYSNRKELVEHGHIAHTKKKYINESKTHICDVCFRRYSKPGPLEVHKQSFVGLDLVYECIRCLTRVTKQNRRQHARTHLRYREPETDLDKSQREQLCCAKDCSASYVTEELLLVHGKETHIGHKVDTDDPLRRYECPVCYKRFEKREALTRHRHRMYRTTHQCAICGKEFKNRYEMLVHERNHDNIKPYSCEICAKRFNSKEAVRVHMLIHSDSKPFSCEICGWRFRRKCNLTKHASKHSADTPFQCNICQKTFKGKYHLQYHMRIHTGHKPWPCRYCDKSFADHANRARHEISHTGIKPYKCSYCDKSFIRRRYQIEHESTHTGIKPYRCEMCNRTFGQKTALKRHLDMHPLASENQKSLEQPSPMSEIQPMSPELPR